MHFSDLIPKLSGIELTINITYQLMSGSNFTQQLPEHSSIFVVDLKRYKILGACNQPYAYKAKQTEDKLGTMLPCNVLIIEQGQSEIEITAVNPAASMQAITNASLGDIAACLFCLVYSQVNFLNP